MEFIIEKTSSKTGLHKKTKRVYIVNKNGQVREYEPIKRTVIKGTYKKGEAYKTDLPLISKDEVIIYLDFTLNIKKHVKGKIYVYDRDGNLKLVLNYEKLKIRRSRGDRSYVWAVKFLIEKLNIPVKRINLMTGKD